MTATHEVLFASPDGLDCVLVEQSLFSLLPALTIHYFLSGEDLLARLDPVEGHEKPDLVIVDLYLSDFDGLELADIIRQLGCCKDVQVLILGGLSGDCVEQAKALRPEWHYLQKAESLDEMERNLKAALEDILGVSG